MQIHGVTIRVHNIENKPKLTSQIPPTSNDQHLVVQLRRDAHEQSHIQIVVVGGEGLGGGAARDHVHHRRLDLEKAELVKEAAHVGDDLRAHLKLLAHLRVDDEVQVALAVPRLLVLIEKYSSLKKKKIGKVKTGVRHLSLRF
jgi:hypothetical protein